MLGLGKTVVYSRPEDPMNVSSSSIIIKPFYATDVQKYSSRQDLSACEYE